MGGSNLLRLQLILPSHRRADVGGQLSLIEVEEVPPVQPSPPKPEPSQGIRPPGEHRSSARHRGH